MSSKLIRAAFEEHVSVFTRVQNELSDEILLAADILSTALLGRNKVLFCGNGGSAADCQHLAAELVGRFVNDRIPLPAIALTTDTSSITAIANDYHFDDIFARQVQALAREGDVLIGISTSGNSANVIKAIQAANELGVKTIGMAGRDGGLLRSVCDQPIVVPSETTARIQEVHIFIGHMLCALIEAKMKLG
jgi:D-sedoheptulose 7-phosphate isomerase